MRIASMGFAVLLALLLLVRIFLPDGQGQSHKLQPWCSLNCCGSLNLLGGKVSH